MTLERLWAGWRSQYIQSFGGGGGGGADADHDDETATGPGIGDRGGNGSAEDCVFCRILASGDPDERTYVVRRHDTCVAILNAFPYVSGHLMVMPVRHVPDLEDVQGEEAAALWRMLADAVRALKQAYSPDGVNVGANLGRSAGAGVPGHFHLHCLPRWSGDTNFMTTVAETRVLPEALPDTWARLVGAWPS